MKKYYHYTSIGNWKKIKKQGLKKYPIERIHKNLQGVFLWKNKLKGTSHAGAIIWQMGTKNSEEVVLLEITCEKKGFEADQDYGQYHKGDTLVVDYNGEMEKLTYHKKEKGIIYFKEIPIENIKLLKVYKLKNAFK